MDFNPLSSDSRVNIRSILLIARKRKWFIIVPFFVVSLGTFGATYLLTPVFESSVTIWTGTDLVLSSDLERVVGAFQDMFFNPAERQAQIAGLQKEVSSSAYLVELITRLRLDEDPAIEHRAREFLNQRPGETLQEAKYEILINELRRGIRLDLIGREYVRISATSSDANRSKDLAATLGEIFISEKARQLESRINTSSSFSFDQLAKYDQELQTKIDEKTRLEREGLQFQLTAPSASESNMKEINAEIQATNLEIEEKKGNERKILAQLSDMPKSRLQLVALPGLEAKRKEIGSAVGAMVNLVKKNAWNAPTVNGLKLKIFGLESELEGEIGRLVETQFGELEMTRRDTLQELFVIREHVGILSSISNGLDSALTDMYGRIDRIPEYQARIEKVEREISSLRELRDRLQSQKEGFQISQAALQGSRFKLLEPAKIPLKPVWPDRLKLSLVGLILGLVLGIAVVLAVELFDTSIKSVEEAEQLLGLPVLGTIPKITQSGKIFRGN